VRRGLAPTRERARTEIASGRVLVAGALAERASRLVGAEEPIVLRGEPPRFVGRGGEKLDAALDAFALDVRGSRVLDAGASTGGFTDCVLQRGATNVVAVDVGRGQLHERLRADARVTVLERTNVRHLSLADLGEDPFPFVVADLSFISLTAVAEALLALAAPGADLVLLVKPQFEAGRAEASRGRGVIRDPLVHTAAIARVRAAFKERGAAMIGLMASPIAGADGNVEFLAHVEAPGNGVA
jgi:23S rRNA (cytidine1920-2'-O)/16S rRNA (cytidine1409-2'-O)-methyltransferase